MTHLTGLRVYFFTLFLTIILTFSLFQVFGHEARAEAEPRGRVVRLRRVIDGDTIVVGRGERLRYIGIDTPEKGEAFFEEAREMNKTLLKAGPIEIVECMEEKKDRYGRTLAWVYAGGRLVNGELLSSGLARKLIIPPCGLEKRALLERLAWQARSSGKGLWRGKGKPLAVRPEEAGRHMGEMVRIKGLVREVRERPRVVLVEFAEGGKSGFTAVIFSEALQFFKEAGVDPLSFSGSMLSVTGVLRRYKGKPEIILVDPGQVRIESPSKAP